MTHIWDHELAKDMIEQLIKGMTFEPRCMNPYRHWYDDNDDHCCDSETTDLVESMLLDDEEASAQWYKEYFVRAARPHHAHFWEPRLVIGTDVYDHDAEDGGYWIYWYTRMTSDWSFAETAARYFAERDDKVMAELWRETARDIRRMGIDFGTALYALGSIVRATEPKETP